MEFEWDPAKAAANLAKHRIDFEDAIGVFEHEVIETPGSAGPDQEPRYLTIGQVDRRLITVVWTWRGGARRIISARRARRRERQAYRTTYGSHS